MLLHERCQRQNLLAAHSAGQWLRSRWERGVSLRKLARERLSPSLAPDRERLGRASRYAEGAFVRVLDEAAVRATFDDKSGVRGLVWIPQQWECCGSIYRVLKVVRRLLDDRGQVRPVSGTVLLAGATCSGRSGSAGCGRSCPMLFRDEWLQSAEPPPITLAPPIARSTSEATPAGYARIKSAAAIRATLDLFGCRDGLRFMPEMYRYAAQRYRIAGKLREVFECERYLPPAMDVYVLDELHCSGAILGEDGPCDRACALLWHSAWLDLEPTCPELTEIH